jgi:hypothetical protein
LQGIAWGGTALSLVFFIFRISVRIRAFKKVYLDDYLVLVAWLSLLASAIIWQTQQVAMYTQYELSAGRLIPTPKLLAAEKTFLRTEVATIFLFYVCLWCVKISFLVFFRRLEQHARGHRIWWWCVFGFTVATWATCIGNIQYHCLLGALEYIFSTHSPPGVGRYQAHRMQLIALDQML